MFQYRNAFTTPNGIRYGSSLEGPRDVVSISDVQVRPQSAQPAIERLAGEIDRITEEIVETDQAAPSASRPDTALTRAHRLRGHAYRFAVHSLLTSLGRIAHMS